MLHALSRVLLASGTALLFALSFGTGVSEVQPQGVRAGPFVQPQVQQALATRPTVEVIITLQEPEDLAGSAADIAVVRAAVAAQQEDVLAGLSASDFTPTQRYQALPVLAGRVSSDGLAKLSSEPTVVSISSDGVGTIATDRTLPIIHAPEVHANGVTGEGVVVAVLDTGTDIDHPDLANDILYEACFASDCDNSDHPANDEHGHGTNVTGIITSDGNIAPLGVAPDAKIAVYRVLRRSGSGDLSDWIAALDDIIANHPEVNVVNMSLQSRFACPSPALSLAVNTLRDRGVVTFIAAGNHGNKAQLTVPACVTEALSVGATYDNNMGRYPGWKSDCVDETTAVDQVACWSDSDDTLDLLAPGARVTSTGVGGGTVTFGGTSQAAPHAAGVAALLLQAHPGLTVNEVEARMEATGTPLTDDLADEDPATNRSTPRIDARVALLDATTDTDGDGCTNGEEFGSDPRFGGRRNPLNPWDFHDVNGDGVVGLFDDILAVINGFGSAGGDPLLDRSPAPPATDPWRQGPPDGTVDIANDILGIAAQFGHRCAGPA